MADHQTTNIRGALREALSEAYWQRGVLTDEHASDEDREIAGASVVAAFLSKVPAGIEATTLLAQVKEIANG